MASDTKAKRIDALRDQLWAQGVDGFIVPRGDEFQGEYIPPHAERLKWLTNFTGTAGSAVVLVDKAAFFTDGRYTLQATQQVDQDAFEIRNTAETKLTDWLSDNMEEGARIGYDAWLHTREEVKKLKKALARKGGKLKTVKKNPVDELWHDQPDSPIGKVIPHPINFTGLSSEEKRKEISEILMKERMDSYVLTNPDSVAWLLNIRGADVPYTPLPLLYAFLYSDGSVDLFIDPRKVDEDLEEHLGEQVRLRAPNEIENAIAKSAEKRIGIDEAAASEWFFQQLSDVEAEIVQFVDPCSLPKAKKNDVELNGMIAAHKRDGAAIVKFLRWIDEQEKTSEIDAAKRLEKFRRESEEFRDLSFPTISGFGPHGAIVHYGVTEESNLTIMGNGLYLVDSGAQYIDGTTDITRTIAIGTPTEEQKDRFTRVLKGHIALCRAKFPVGTNGSQLDVLARQHLWDVGLDYDHGTGHGVGCYLSVHEGPQRISKACSDVKLAPGMVLSNEPGYYKTQQYGIRIENLVVVVPKEKPQGGEREMLSLVPITRAPIDRRLIKNDLLTSEEKAWLNGYHKLVYDDLHELLDDETKQWLIQATLEIQ